MLVHDLLIGQIKNKTGSVKKRMWRNVYVILQIERSFNVKHALHLLSKRHFILYFLYDTTDSTQSKHGFIPTLSFVLCPHMSLVLSVVVFLYVTCKNV